MLSKKIGEATAKNCVLAVFRIRNRVRMGSVFDGHLDPDFDFDNKIMFNQDPNPHGSAFIFKTRSATA
jgi:hypothetical protein